MNEKQKFHTAIGAIISAALTLMVFTMKACNDSDNEIIANAISRGCTVIHCDIGRIKIFCGGDPTPHFCQ